VLRFLFSYLPVGNARINGITNEFSVFISLTDLIAGFVFYFLLIPVFAGMTKSGRMVNFERHDK
jgi:hypothetical protein